LMAGAAAPLWKPPVDRTRAKGWPSLAGRYTGFSVTEPRAVVSGVSHRLQQRAGS